jgi:hypothetical protein
MGPATYRCSSNVLVFLEAERLAGIETLLVSRTIHTPLVWCPMDGETHHFMLLALGDDEEGQIMLFQYTV